MNESLTDQIRLLKNQLSRQRQEHEDKLSEVRHEFFLKHSTRMDQEGEHVWPKNTIKSSSIEKDLPIPDCMSKEEVENDAENGKHVSDIEVVQINQIHISIYALRCCSNYNNYIFTS